MMTDEQFIPAALALLEEDTINAAVACLSIQARDHKRLTPATVIAIAKALNARPAPVLILLGWLAATGDRPTRRLFFDIFTSKGAWRMPANREELAALALAKTAVRESTPKYRA
jgi:hypothetical protein